jgi:hypothetical protein
VSCSTSETFIQQLSVSSQGSYTRKASLSPTSPKANSTPSDAGITRTNLKVSFKDRIRNLQRETPKDEKVATGSTESADAKQHLIPSTSAVKPKKLSTTQQLKDKLKSFSQIPKDELTPWSKLKLATVVSLGGSYSSLNNSITGDSPKLSKTTITKSSMPVDLNVKLDDSLKPLNNTKPEQKTSVSDSELKTETSAVTAKVKRKPRPFKIVSEPKNYRSVDDLSPEYSGLPFVKKLKILNERIKLAELESVIQTRSFSLDCTDSSNSNEMVEVLTRSQSEASCMVVRPKPVSLSSPIVPVAPLNFTSHVSIKSPLSPESNETLERKQLKSILKRLSEDRLAQNVNVKGERTDMKRLMRAQTVEGYVARRTKFTKSVTFNNTLSSPPNSSTLPEEPEDSAKQSPPHPAISPCPPQALYPILNAQEISTTLESSQKVLSNQIMKTTTTTDTDQSTNRFNFSADYVAISTEETMIQTATKKTPSTQNPKAVDDPSRSFSFVSDDCGQRKLVKGIPFNFNCL